MMLFVPLCYTNPSSAECCIPSFMLHHVLLFDIKTIARVRQNPKMKGTSGMKFAIGHVSPLFHTKWQKGGRQIRLYLDLHTHATQLDQ